MKARTAGITGLIMTILIPFLGLLFVSGLMLPLLGLIFWVYIILECITLIGGTWSKTASAQLYRYLRDHRKTKGEDDAPSH